MEKKRERNINVREREPPIGCFSHAPWLGTEPATQACALKSSGWPFVWWRGTQPAELHHSGLYEIFKSKFELFIWKQSWEQFQSEYVTIYNIGIQLCFSCGLWSPLEKKKKGFLSLAPGGFTQRVGAVSILKCLPRMCSRFVPETHSPQHPQSGRPLCRCPVTCHGLNNVCRFT